MRRQIASERGVSGVERLRACVTMSARASEGCTEIDEEWREDDGELSGDEDGVCGINVTSVVCVCLCVCVCVCVSERCCVSVCVQVCTVEQVIDLTHDTSSQRSRSE